MLMPPVAAGTTLSRLWPPLSVRRSAVENPGRLASATTSLSTDPSTSGRLACQGTSSTPPKLSEPGPPCRSAAPSAPASLEDRYCTSALAICSLDCSCRANAGARPRTRSARSASRSVRSTSTAIQLAAASVSSTPSVTTTTIRRRIDENETGPVCMVIVPCGAHGRGLKLLEVPSIKRQLLDAAGVRIPTFGENRAAGLPTASQSRVIAYAACRQRAHLPVGIAIQATSPTARRAQHRGRDRAGRNASKARHPSEQQRIHCPEKPLRQHLERPQVVSRAAQHRGLHDVKRAKGQRRQCPFGLPLDAQIKVARALPPPPRRDQSEPFGPRRQCRARHLQPQVVVDSPECFRAPGL